MNKKPSVGVSSCLLGELVRYDGGHKRNSMVVDELSQYFQLESYCPEVLMGLGVPRDPIQLRQIKGEVHLVRVQEPFLDLTQRAQDTFQKSHKLFSGLSGFVLKSKSPSCGINSVELFDNLGDSVVREGSSGYLVQYLQAEFPHLVLIDEMSLQKPEGLQQFVQSVLQNS